MKRFLAFSLAIIMLFALCACTGGGNGGKIATNDPLTKDDVIDITITSHPSWPYLEDWKVWEYIEEGTGVTLNVTCFPGTDAGTKYPLMFAARDTLSDVVSFTYKPDTEKYVMQGALVALDDMAEYMPNYKAWVESLSEDEYENVVKTRKSADGKIYYAPVSGRERSQNVRAWLYRKDIFDKHGLSVPTTYDEVYEVSKKLKEIYPDSYPYGVRSGMTVLDTAGSNWKEYWAPGAYYDYNEGKWYYGATEDVMLDMITYYKRMVDEGLTSPDFMTINIQSWQELVTTDRSFLMPDYLTRIDFFNSIARDNNPEFNLTAFVPPVANPETGKAQLSKVNYESVGFTISNTGDEKRMANAAKFVDWFYSDEALELMSWGKEGETYEVKDGKKVYIKENENDQVNTLYGFFTHGTFARLDPEAVEATESAEVSAVRDMAIRQSDPYYNPTSYLSFSNEENKVIDETFAACRTFSEEMITKLILGQEPLSKFDEMVQSLRDLGTDRLIGVYESAYNRVKG